VPRFYFDVSVGDDFTRDDEGFELASLEVAERDAKRGAAEIGRDSLPKDCPEISVQVRDQHSERVLTVTVPSCGQSRHCSGTVSLPTAICELEASAKQQTIA
jgi:hypothetical protein